MATTGSDGEPLIRSIADTDVAGAGEALDDNSGETSWWYDLASGQITGTTPK